MNKSFDFNIRGANLSVVFNRNEKRVALAMKKILGAMPDWQTDTFDIQDVFALSLNYLPPRYVQYSTLVINDPVSDMDIEKAVKEAIRVVQANPNY